MSLTRPSTIWSVFAICLAVLLLAMAWVTRHTLRLDADRRQVAAESELQERIRLALWRMDSAAGAIVFAESARSPDQFRDFHPADQLYTSGFQPVPKGQVIVPSPLLSSCASYVNLYCQIESNGDVTSPQVPAGNKRDLAEQNYLSQADIIRSMALLDQAGRMLPQTRNPTKAVAVTESQSALKQRPKSQEARNNEEFRTRSKRVEQTQNWASSAYNTSKMKATNDLALQQAALAGVNLTTPDRAEAFTGVWRESELFLDRKATLDGEEVTQSVWLNAEEIRKLLLDEINDLLPNATLVPVREAALSGAFSEHLVRNLASLPFRLEPGEVAIQASSLWSPLRRSLVIAWACILAAALAAGVLIRGIVALSERRGAFVSAVTHEMRTPLTTFRLYSEMLSDGMVKDPEKQKSYLGTLTSEADRLSHLVENVLAYAQLERGSARARVEEISLQGIIDRVLPRLTQRASEVGAAIQVDADPSAVATRVVVDLTAVEQILFNLVDNACKYGVSSEGENKTIHLEADTDGPKALLRVRDHGRGISRSEARRLFKPFEKSATEAAHTAPGVGLGLALCRKLSRALGGELDLCPESSGACFVLKLPVLALAGDRNATVDP
ncbi:MAG: HAMP domain-containing sensor histidine kinase [Verrucomicrobiota bacterium]